ncbi:MAG: 50S ribosome-binding GTPase [Candidatus Pacebacteria bacterium]|nr:50S ribosome-binding GTPase [Candidatus Paceibacterota bacterium]
MYQIASLESLTGLQDLESRIAARESALTEELQHAISQIEEYLHRVFFPEPFLDMQGRKVLKLLVLGKTGAGKTTFINAFATHFARRGYKDPRIVISAEAAGEQSASKTHKTQNYMIENDKYRIELTDTPGFGDTDISREDGNIMNIFNGILSTCSYNAVCVVYPESGCRADIACQYTLSQIKQIVPQSCLNRLILCLTNCTGSGKTASETVKRVLKAPGMHVFTFENGAMEKGDDSYDESVLEGFWERTQKEYQRMIECVEKNFAEQFELYDFARLAYYHAKYSQCVVGYFRVQRRVQPLVADPAFVKGEPPQQPKGDSDSEEEEDNWTFNEQKAAAPFDKDTMVLMAEYILRKKLAVVAELCNPFRVKYLTLVQQELRSRPPSVAKKAILQVVAGIIKFEQDVMNEINA